MKKIFLSILFFICLFVLNPLSTFALDIKIKNLEVIEKSTDITIENNKYTNNDITSGIEFKKLNDFVTYKITLENNDSIGYIIDSISDNNENKNIKVSYSYDDNKIKSKGNKDIYITLRYDKKLVNKKQLSINNLVITLNLVDPEGKVKSAEIIPTGDNALKYIIIFVIALILLIFGLILLKRRKGKGNKKIILLLLMFIPTIVSAKKELQLNISFKNIIIDGEMLPYSVSIEDENGNITNRTILYGDKIGELPTVSKVGYNFLMYVDDNNDEVTSDTIVKGNMNVIPKFETIKYDITYDYDGGSATNPDKYTIEDEITLNNPTKQGYTFAGWTGSNGNDNQTRVTIYHETENKNFVAHYSPNERTPYKVIHRYPNLDGTYEEVEETLYGPTESEVTPSLLPKEGFKGPEELETIVINGDESSKVIYTYTREQYDLIVENPEYINEGDLSGKYYYGQVVTLTAKPRTHYTFSKWSNNVEINPINLEIKSDTRINALYTKNKYTISFNTEVGDSTSSIEVDGGNAIGQLPILTDREYIFEGWYLEDKITKVTSDYVPTKDMTLYAKWTSKFPIVFSQSGSCTFNGENNITGNECTDYNSSVYINTGIKLYSSTNKNKDYEVGFNIEHLNFNEEIRQATLFNSKYEDEASNYPGVVFRRYELKNKLQISNNSYGNTEMDSQLGNLINKVQIVRKGNALYYAYNDSFYKRLTMNDEEVEQFDTPATFGASLTNEGLPFRNFNGTLSNMYIKLGEYIPNKKTITFDPNGGVLEDTTKKLNQLEKIGTLPVPTKEGYVFAGWYVNLNDNEKITPDLYVNNDITVHAKWIENSNTISAKGKYFTSLQSAIDSIDESDGIVTIDIYMDIKENISIPSGKDIIINANGHTIEMYNNDAVISNSGKLVLNDAKIVGNSSSTAAINNNNRAILTINGGEINVTGSKQALYNNGGTVTIEDNTLLTSTSTNRATVQNLDNGKLYLNSCTIKSSKFNAVKVESGTMSIGNKDGEISINHPIIQGYNYGIESSIGYSLYDGTIKGITNAVNNKDLITDKEDNSDIVEGAETISGKEYETLHLDF